MFGQLYGGYQWQQEPLQPNPSYGSRALALAAATGAIGGAGYLATTQLASGRRPIDYLYSGSRFLGNLSPMEVGNTFRIPEFISPFISNQQRGGPTVTWSAQHLQGEETRRWLREVTGVTDQQLDAGGFGQQHTRMEWTQHPGKSTGRLSLVNQAGRAHHLSDDVWAMRSTAEEVGLFDRTERKVNKAVYSVAQSLGLTEKPGFDIDQVLSHYDGALKKQVHPSWLPVPSVTGKLANWGDLGRRTAYLRAPAAFGLERVNTLLGNTLDQIPVIGGLNTALDKIVGQALPVMSGPATSMYARLGGKAALIGGGALAFQQADWIRQQGGDLGHLGVSAGFAGALAYLTNKAGHSPKTAMMVGVAAFFGQTVLPGFDEGVIPGLATTYANSAIARANPLNPMSHYRRIVEGMAPGVSDWQVGLLGGVGVAAAFSLPTMFTQGKTLPDWAINKFGHSAFGLPTQISMGTGSASKIVDVAVPRGTKQIFWQTMHENIRSVAHVAGNHATMQSLRDMEILPLAAQRANLLRELSRVWESGKSQGRWSATQDPLSYMNKMWSQASETATEEAKLNPFNELLVRQYHNINQKYHGQGMMGQASGFAEKAAQTMKYTMLGADPGHMVFKEAAGKMGSMGTGRLAVLIGIPLLAQQVLTGGLFGSMESAGQLEAQFSGKELVAVRKGRFWEGGGTPYEGDQISYYRPSAIALTLNRVRERGLWGEDEQSISPISKWIKKNFSYDWEEQHYYDRPYPVTGGFGESIPVIGGFVAATIGQVIKPQRIMHPDEWIQPGASGGFETADVYQGWRREPAYDMGGQGSGVPITPLSPWGILGRAHSQFRELEGLPGFVSETFQKAVTGSGSFFQDESILQSADWANSPVRAFLETQQGGGMFLNEVVRRFLPKPPSEQKRINPIMNAMPSWLPDKMKYGDPYSNIEWGEARLPGVGFETLHPELRGMDPENYPLAYQYSILADVAPYSRELELARNAMYRRRRAGQTTESENLLIDQTDQMIQTKMAQYGQSTMDNNATDTPFSHFTRNAWFGAQKLVRESVAPIEYAGSIGTFGVRPVQKLLSDRDPIEQYEFERLYGTKFSFWDQPIRDWFRPSFYSAARFMGWQGKPGWRQDADDTNAYFDKLEFMKWNQLADQAREMGDTRAAIKYQYMAGGTRTGINPNADPMSIYWTLPAEERPFFNAFANAQGAERERIKEMIPADQAQLYQSMWSRLDRGQDPRFGGVKNDPVYLEQQRARIAQDLGGPMPAPDWVGWHDSVSVNDIKTLYVNSLGRDLHDYGLWQCVPPEQLILTAVDRFTSAHSIQKGQTIYQSNQEYTVLDIHTRDACESMVELKIQNNHLQSMRATSNHEVFAWKMPFTRAVLGEIVNPWHKHHGRTRQIDITPKWIPIGDLQVGDYLVVPLETLQSQANIQLDMADLMANVPRIKYDDQHVWSYYKDKQHAALLDRYIDITPDLAWLVGYYAAEGDTGRNKCGSLERTRWTSNANEEQDLRDKLRTILSNMSVTSYEKLVKIKTGYVGKVGCSGPLTWLLSQYFMPGVCHTKTLQRLEDLLLSEAHILSFLSGLFCGDGSKKASSSSLTTTSKVLAEQVFQLMITVGLVPTLVEETRSNRKPRYRISLCPSDEKGWLLHQSIIRATEVQRRPAYHHLNGFKYGQNMFFEISSAQTTQYDGKVYDFHIEQMHSYRSPIGLYHNSQLNQAQRQPYLEGAEAPFQGAGIERGQLAGFMRRFLGSGQQAPFMLVNGGPGLDNRVVWNDAREPELMERIQGYQ